MASHPPAILVVDDEEGVRLLFTDYLSSLGYVVRTAPDGLVALTMLRAAPARFGLVLLDLMMPRVDGYHFREEQLADPNIAQIPVVVLTASSRIRDTDLPSMIDQEHALPKPPDFEWLLVLVRRYCGVPPR